MSSASARVPRSRPCSSPSAALGWISSHVAKGTKLVADEAPSWNDLHSRYEIADRPPASLRLDGIYSNGAECFFSRLRRGEIGHHHHVAGPYLVRYAQEAAWREDNRRVSNGEQVRQTVRLALASKPRPWISAGTGSGTRRHEYETHNRP